MHKRSYHLYFIILLFSLTACGGRSAAPTPQPDVEATVQAAVAATATGQASIQATIDGAVQATAAAQPTATPAPTAAPVVVAPTPVVITQVVTEAVSVAETGAAAEIATAAETGAAAEIATAPPEVYMTMSEEELAALIEQTVAQASAAAASYAAATTQATSDGAVTTSDVETIEVYVQLAEESVAYAEDLVNAYYELYGATADAMLAAVVGVESELATISTNTASMAASLDEIETTLDAGLTLAEESVDQLEQAAASAAAAAGQMQTQAQALAGTVQTQLQNLPAAGNLQEADAVFAAIIQNTQPQVVAGNQIGAFQSVFTYVDTVRGALGDNAVSAPEMQAIAQAGANAVAGLNAHGGAQFNNLGPALNDVTNAVARGELERARQGLQDVEGRMPSRDTLSGPGIGGNAGEGRPGGRRP
jgi:hypothetical protein